MPIPPALHALAQDREFWAGFFFQADAHRDYPQLDGCNVDLPISHQYGLRLCLDQHLSGISLQLRHPQAAEPVEIAWDDQAHWHPHALRWEELDLLGRCVALNDPDLPHPGLPVVLLCRFTPICAGDDPDVVIPLLEAALRSLHTPPRLDAENQPTLPGLELAPLSRTRPVLTDGDVQVYLERCDLAFAGFTWRHDPDVGWWIDQSDEDERRSGWGLYSLRDPRVRQFPFPAWDALVRRARQRCAEAVSPNWLDPETIVPLAQEIMRTGDLAQAPALGVALRAAGCDHPTILGALAEPLAPARACWVVELLLNVAPGSLLKRHFGPTGRRRRTR